MYLIIGLGNPGEKYKNTLHNVGFRAVEEFQKKLGFPDFRFDKKFNAETSEGLYNEEKFILAKPQTFMNKSGQAVKALTKRYPLNADNLISIHDDIDLPLGKIKISKGSGAGGHKGVDSIIKSLGTKDFVRLRIGILPELGKPKNVETFVLKNFTKDEEKTIKEVLKKSSEAIEALLREGIEKTMSLYNC